MVGGQKIFCTAAGGGVVIDIFIVFQLTFLMVEIVGYEMSRDRADLGRIRVAAVVKQRVVLSRDREVGAEEIKCGFHWVIVGWGDNGITVIADIVAIDFVFTVVILDPDKGQ